MACHISGVRLPSAASHRRDLTHHALEGAVDGPTIDAAFARIEAMFTPQLIRSTNYPEWKISRYMEVSRDDIHSEKQGGAFADPELLAACGDDLLAACDAAFARCYDALHAGEGRAPCAPRRLQARRRSRGRCHLVWCVRAGPAGVAFPISRGRGAA